MKASILLPITFVCICVSLSVRAQRIDFETLPNGVATTDRMIVSNQFAQPPFGVSFQFEDGTYPQIAKVGPPLTAFWGPPNHTTRDKLADGQDVGLSFLTDDGEVADPPPPLIITYAQPVAAASAFILDIDHQEAWDIQARNAATQVVAQVHLEAHTPATGDGVATPWSFRRPSADIYSIRIAYAGKTNSNPGLAFDNFSTIASLPTPQPARLTLQCATNSVSLTITGTVSAVYVIETADSLPSTNWTAETSVVLSSTTLTLTNFVDADLPGRFFRIRGVDFQ